MRMNCVFGRHLSPVYFTVSATKSTFLREQLILTRLAASKGIIKHLTDLRKPRKAIFVLAENMGLEMSYSLGSIKTLQLSDLIPPHCRMFAGQSTKRARISCISVHNACSKSLLFAGNYAV